VLTKQMRHSYGFDRPLPVQFGIWLWKAVHGNLGTSIATGRPVAEEVGRAVGNTVMLAAVAATIGFSLGLLRGSSSSTIESHYEQAPVAKINCRRISSLL
jgi:peptide/nickel transport system permease protein